MVWNGRPREWRLSDECHGRSEWNDAAAALRLRWQSPRPVKAKNRRRCRLHGGASPGAPRGNNGMWRRLRRNRPRSLTVAEGDTLKRQGDRHQAGRYPPILETGHELCL